MVNGIFSGNFNHMLYAFNYEVVFAVDDLNTALKKKLSDSVMAVLKHPEQEFLVLMRGVMGSNVI